MQKVIAQILDSAASDDPEIHDSAVLQIAMLLEKHSSLKGDEDFYNSVLSSQLKDITLSKVDEQELIDRLYQLIMTCETNASMIWALGKTTSINALERLLFLACEQTKSISEDATWQMLIAIDKFLSVDQPSEEHSEISRIIKEYDLAASLQDLIDTNSTQIKDLAGRMLRKLSVSF